MTVPDAGAPQELRTICRELVDAVRRTGEPVEWFPALSKLMTYMDFPEVARAAHQGRTEPEEWRCFHCDEVFTDKAEAREHFGEMMDDDPLCKIKADEGGLAGEIRRLEAEVLRVCNERNAYENDARLWHEADADRRRRIGNLQWWQELDNREGEKLVLQERVAELEKQVAAPARAAEWQPPETAVNHERVLGCWEWDGQPPSYAIAARVDRCWFIDGKVNGKMVLPPTYWMRFPLPPGALAGRSPITSSDQLAPNPAASGSTTGSAPSSVANPAEQPIPAPWTPDGSPDKQ